MGSNSLMGGSVVLEHQMPLSLDAQQTARVVFRAVRANLTILRERLERSSKPYLDQTRIYNSQIPMIRDYWIKNIVGELTMSAEDNKLWNGAFHAELSRLENGVNVTAPEKKNYYD
jgi:hypothetical protein